MQQSSHSFFSIKTQFENVGDALINREMITLAAQQTNIHVDVSRCPADFIKTLDLDQITSDKNHNVTQYHNSFILFFKMLFLRITGKNCYYFLSPGGYFGEISGFGFFKKYINLLILLCFKMIGIRICHVGVSYERLGNKFANFLKKRSRYLFGHYVRDNLSYQYAQALGIHIDGEMPDLAFNLFKTNKPDHDTHTLNKICFSFRADQYDAQKDEIIRLVTHIIQNNNPDTEYRLIAQVKRDVEFMRTLQNKITALTGQQTKLHIAYDNIISCLEFYEQSNLIISNRLHVLLMGGSRTDHILACVNHSHNMKIKGIMETLGLSNQMIHLEQDISKKDWDLYLDYAKKPLNGHPYYLNLEAIFSDLLNRS